MRSFRTLIVAALAVAALAVALPASAEGKYPGVKKVLRRTHPVLVAAWHAAKKGGEAKGEYRTAVVYQRAAVRALLKDKPVLATKLSLVSRAHARNVIRRNKQEPKAELAEDTAEETKAAEGVSDADVEAAVKEDEKAAPSEDDLLKEEPKDLPPEKKE